MPRLASAILAVVLVIALSACDRTNQETSLFRTVNDEKATLVTDAKQRVVVNQASPNTRRVCAEPSPDVTQAFSEAVKIAASISASKPGAGGAEKSLNASGEFANSFAGSVAQLGERLAVIQLFRDRMYRACEAYANGAIDQVAYTLMLARNDKTMATLLTTEMAAGAFGRTLANLGGTAAIAGVDPEKRAQLQQKIETLTSELADIAKSDDTDRAKKADAKADELTKAHAELLALDLAAARSAASSSAISAALGAINNRAQVAGVISLSSEIAGIHRTYLDDPGLEPLTDACLTSLSTIELKSEQATQLANANVSRDEAVKLLNQKTLDENTVAFLRELRAGGGENLTDAEIKNAKDLGVHTNADGTISNAELDAAIERSRTSRASAEAKLRAAKVSAASVLLQAGNPFASFCVNNVFGDQSNNGYIRTLIDTRRELRLLGRPTDAEVALKQLEICQTLTTGLKDQPADAQTKILSMCENSIR